jgi:hypothetical protein
MSMFRIPRTGAMLLVDIVIYTYSTYSRARDTYLVPTTIDRPWSASEKYSSLLGSS